MDALLHCGKTFAGRIFRTFSASFSGLPSRTPRLCPSHAAQALQSLARHRSGPRSDLFLLVSISVRRLLASRGECAVELFSGLLFHRCLQTLFRAWDLFFLEGMDALFRIAVAILRINEAELLDCDSISSLYMHLESMTTRMWQPDKLLKVRRTAFPVTFASSLPWQFEADLKPLITHNDLVKRREAHVAALSQFL